MARTETASQISINRSLLVLRVLVAILAPVTLIMSAIVAMRPGVMIGDQISILVFVVAIAACSSFAMLYTRQPLLHLAGCGVLSVLPLLALYNVYINGVQALAPLAAWLLIVIAVAPARLKTVSGYLYVTATCLTFWIGGHDFGDPFAKRLLLVSALVVWPVVRLMNDELFDRAKVLNYLLKLTAGAGVLVYLSGEFDNLYPLFASALMLWASFKVRGGLTDRLGRGIALSVGIAFMSATHFYDALPLPLLPMITLWLIIALPAFEALLLMLALISSGIAAIGGAEPWTLAMTIRLELCALAFALVMFVLSWSKEPGASPQRLWQSLSRYGLVAAVFGITLVVVNLMDLQQQLSSGTGLSANWLAPHLMLWLLGSWAGYALWNTREAQYKTELELESSTSASEFAFGSTNQTMVEIDLDTQMAKLVAGHLFYPDLYKKPVWQAYAAIMSETDLQRMMKASRNPGTEVEVVLHDPQTREFVSHRRVRFTEPFVRAGRRLQMFYSLDISETVQQKQLAQKAIAELERTAMAGRIGLFYHDLKTDTYQVNQVYRELRALPEAEYPVVRLEHVLERVAEEYREAYLADVLAARDNLEASTLQDVKLRLPDGTEVFQEVVARPIYEDGELVAMTGSVHDVTAKTLAKLSLEQTSAVQSDLLDRLHRELLSINLISRAAHVARWSYSTEKREFSFADEVYRLFSVTEPASLTQLSDIEAFIDAEDRRYFTSVIKRLGALVPMHLSRGQIIEQKLAKMNANSRIESEPFRAVLSGRGLRWLKVVCASYQVDGEAVQVMGCFIDVTDEVHAQRKAEQRFDELKAATEQANLYIFEENLTLQEGSFITDPMRFPSKTGVPLVGKALYQAVPKEYHAEIERCYSALGYIAEFPIQLANDHLWVRQQLVRKFTRGEARMATVIVQDVSDMHHDRILLEASLEEKELLVDELEAQRERQRRMFAVIGHELRTPAATLHMLLEQQEISALEPHGREIEDTSKHLLSVLDDLRNVVRAEGSELGEITTDNPVQLLYRAVGPVQKLFEENAIQVRIVSREVYYSQLTGNFQALRQIITNLVKNAALYSGATEIRVSASTEAVDDRVRLNLTVEDNGKGISPEFQSRLFTAFERNNQDRDGTGLGLYICRDLARKLEGDIHYTDAPGGGARFSVSVMFELEGAADVAQQASEPSTPAELAPLKGQRVLVAEDNSMLQLLTRKLLENAGAEVEVTGDGEQALQRLRSSQFDLLISDIFMPQMDGYELCRQARQMGYTLPIVGVSAATIGDETDNMLKAGADVVIPKPLNRIALIDAWNKIREGV